MNILLYTISTIVLVSLSGALAPGPLTIATIIVGSNGGARSGLLVAIGHTIVEFPYVLLLALLATSRLVRQVIVNFYFKLALGVIALAFILYLSYITFHEGIKVAKSGEVKIEPTSSIGKLITNPLTVGIVLTGLNPHFLAWWATIGLALILSVAEYVNILQFLPIFYIAHVWIDYVWLITLAYLSHRGLLKLGRRYGYVLEGLAVLLAVSGILIIIALFRL